MAEQKSNNPVGALSLSYLTSAVLIGSLIYFAGIWNFLGNSRLLDLLITGGVIQYHDTQPGLIAGIPDNKYYLMSQDPINWQLLVLAAVVLVLAWMLRALQFHNCARTYGIAGRYADHARAFFYGVGLNKLLPYNAGAVGMVLALEGDGADRRTASAAAHLSQSMILFEILFFSMIGLLFMGWAVWLGQIFWALVIFAVLFLFMRGSQLTGQATSWSSISSFRSSIVSATQNPTLFIKIMGYSILSFALEHTAVYATAMAFTTANVLLNVDFQLLLMALVGAYIARLIPLTPGGWGQFEWGFATALYIGGVGFPESVTVAVIYGLMRNGVALGMSGFLRLAYGARTSMPEALASMSRTD